MSTTFQAFQGKVYFLTPISILEQAKELSIYLFIYLLQITLTNGTYECIYGFNAVKSYRYLKKVTEKLLKQKE